jgi:hypothetical protein
VHLVVPGFTGETRARQQHVIAPEHTSGHARRTRHHDQPSASRPGPGHPAEPGTQHHRTDTEDHEARHHDLRIPGILRSKATQLYLGYRVTGLTQRADHPRHREQHRTRYPASRRQPAEPHRASITPAPPIRGGPPRPPAHRPAADVE